jgi:large subunit ribosomal protein L30
MARRLRIRQTRSASGHPQDQHATLRALGIRRLQHVVEHNDTPQIRGMVFKVRHLVTVDEVGTESTK